MNLNLSVISVSGDDALTFLQGQLSQDMARLDQHWHYAAHCNPKGRVIGFFIAFKLDKTFYLLTPSELSDIASVQLSKYIMRSKVDVKTLSSHQVHYVSKHADSANSLPIEMDTNDHTAFFQHGTGTDNAAYTDIFLALPKPFSGNLVISNTAQRSAALNDCALSDTQWNTDRINAGVTQLHPNTLGELTPEALNLDLIDAVSFNKGCYTGQEIVARMHYLGKANKRLLGTQLEPQSINNDAELIGSNVVNSSNASVGIVTDYANSEPAEKQQLLISIKVASADEDLFVAGAKTHSLQTWHETAG